MTHSQTDAAEPGNNDNSTKPNPAEGLRLLKAFMNIADPKARAAAIEFVESLARPHTPGAS